MMRRLSGVCPAVFVVALAVAPLAAAKPPDLPQNPTIVVDQQPPIMVNIQAVLTSSLFFGVHPLISVDVAKTQAEEEPQIVCPSHCKEAVQPVHVLTDTGEMQALEQAVKGLEEARRLTEAGLYGQAVERLVQVQAQCPEAAPRSEKAMTEIMTALQPQNASVQEPSALGCCCCFGLNQFGMCWMSWIADCWKQCFKEQDLILLEKPCPRIISSVGPDGLERIGVNFNVEPRKEGNCCAASGGALQVLMQTPVTVSLDGKPLSQVFNDLRTASGLPIVIDQESLTKAGIASLDDVSVTFHVMHAPLIVALDLLLRPYHLTAEVHGCVVCITAKPHGGEETCEEEPGSKECGSACPKCEALHAKHAGTKEQVTGLMKACYLAIGEGRFEKAADLAREAHRLDPARVEGDPLLYKMHLLAEKGRKCGCPKSKDGPANQEADDPGASLCPALPGPGSDVVPALDAILMGKDQLPRSPAATRRSDEG